MDLGPRVWGRTWEGESSGRRAGRAGKGEWVVGSERDLNSVGPKTVDIGQTG